ncbi:hypothetical protein RhiirA1_430016, partial [Rhizophagus irregularis]
DNNRVSYLIQKADILAEIELFYLLPYQRRWQTWFPEIMYYYADVDKTRVEIKRLIKKGEWDTKEFTEMWKILFKVLQIEHNPDDNEAILEKLKSYDEKLYKLDKLEKLDEKLKKLDKLEEKSDKLEILEKSHCEILEKLGKLEALEKSHCEILDKLEKLLERNAC